MVRLAFAQSEVRARVWLVLSGKQASSASQRVIVVHLLSRRASSFVLCSLEKEFALLGSELVAARDLVRSQCPKHRLVETSQLIFVDPRNAFAGRR